MIYYDEPTQVKFFYQEIMYFGIAYQDFIIKDKTGEVLKISDILQQSAKSEDDTIIELEWKPLFK